MVGTERHPPARYFFLQNLDEASRALAIKMLGIKEEQIEQFVPLADFAAAEDQPIMTCEKPVGFVGDASAAGCVEDRTLSPRVQVVMWLLIEAFIDIFNCDLCPKNIAVENIMIDRVSLRPRFVGLVFEPKSTTGIQSCIGSLATLFEEKLLQTHDSSLPLEVKHLLKMMKMDAVALLPLISFHPCLVPVGNRCDYFARMDNYVQDILQSENQVGYDFVLDNLCFPQDWDSRLKTNTHLERFYLSAPADAKYDPQGTTGKDRAQEAMRFHRDMIEYGLYLAPPAPSPHGIQYNRTDIGRMLYSIMDGILCSMAECLQRINQFTQLDLESLFPGRVPRNRNKKA